MLLDSQQILRFLAAQHDTAQLSQSLTLEVFPTLDSTNAHVKRLLQSGDTQLLYVAIAEQQTAGKTSKADKAWFSPAGQNIYLSIGLALENPAKQIPGLSLVIALSIIASLEKLGIQQQLSAKWPNDVYCDGKKICGILVELETREAGKTYAVIGVGINVNMETIEETNIDKPWTSLQLVSGITYDRNKIIALLLQQLCQDLALLQQRGLPHFLPRWAAHDFLHQKNVTIQTVKGSTSGVAVGINHSGQLLLKTSQNGIVAYHDGEINLVY
jgi:BirA family biotin operon repressor/biotin-[acetyl-CoA-carboxylase] ligase